MTFCQISVKFSVSVLFLLVWVMSYANTASADTGTVNKITSGLVYSDSLTTGNTTNLLLGGTATTFVSYEDSAGLHLGIKSPQSDTWVNYYASPSPPNAYLYHAVITLPDAVVADGVFNVGLYVEGSDYIPHVGCEAYADSTGYYWVVEQSSDAGTTYHVLYISPVSSMPHTQDCTIITNGTNYLKVYIGGNVVYSSNTMSLGMSAPFISFVQDDSSSSSMHYATYYDYYATSDETIKVANNPSNAAAVKIVGSSGQVLASSSVVSGIATLDVGKYHLPFAATVNVYDANNNIIASSPANIYGGDVYSVTAATQTTPQPPTNLVASAVSSSQINLSWSAPANNGGSAITGYQIERSNDSGTTWSTVSPNTGSTATSYSDTGLAPSTAYSYRVSAINSVGTSSSSNVSSATTFTPMTVPQPPTGLSATDVSASQINLSWNAPSSDGGSAITGYKIERSQDNGSTWSSIVQNTGSTSTTYSDMGLAASTAYAYHVSAINSVGASSPSNTATATTPTTIHSITKAQSGLVASDSLTNETMTQQQLQANSKYWVYGGDAIAEKAPYNFYRDTQGFHIDIQAPSNGTWAGFYGVTPNTNAALFHAIITTPTRTIPGNYYENGLYVQTSTQNVNYVTCFVGTSSFGTAWAIVSANGNTGGATQFNLLWVDTSPNQSLTRDCTIITNGSNYLKVYLDGTMVYNNSTLNLQMPSPFNAFLEPQTSYAGQMLNGSYKDYYATSDEKIQVIKLSNNAARADLIDSTGNVITSASIASGTAILDVGKYHYPLAANIKVYDSANILIAATTAVQNIYAGDVYSSQ